MNLGQRVKELRTARGWTLPRLAAEAGISKGYVWKIEQSGITRAVNVRPSMETLSKLAAALGVSLDQLTGREEVLRVHHIIPPGVGNDLPRSLVDYINLCRKRKEPLTEEDTGMLAGISYRGKVPRSVEDWDFIMQAIRRTIG